MTKEAEMPVKSRNQLKEVLILESGVDGMEPIKFKECNVNYVADGCKDLPTYKGDNQIISCWELSDDEIKQIIKNKVIWLSIWGEAQPPVCLMSETPFVECQETPHSPCEECDPANNQICTKECQEVCPECRNDK